jgi:hypothetical protein
MSADNDINTGVEFSKIKSIIEEAAKRHKSIEENLDPSLKTEPLTPKQAEETPKQEEPPKVEEPNITIKIAEETAVKPDDFITDFDLHLFQNGTFYKAFEKFGAQVTAKGGINGVQFTTWAPNANSISVIGEFNGWQEGLNEMEKIHDSGVWSVFIPNLKEGDTYKY